MILLLKISVHVGIQFCTCTLIFSSNKSNCFEEEYQSEANSEKRKKFGDSDLRHLDR
jgi:hypothetical protein